MTRLQYFLATGFFSGYSPIAPGTVASLLIFFILWFLAPLSLAFHSFMIGLFFVVGVWASSRVAIDRKDDDPSLVVIDEMDGMLFSLLGCPKRFFSFLTALLLFRLFDIVKPFPIKYAEQLPLGWGIMLDDVLAGVYALIIVQVLLRMQIV